MAKERVGIMGGTFDPIHNGHLVIAESVRDAFSLSKVIFIPAADPPHKPAMIDAVHRLRMVWLATNSNPYFQVLDIELKREGPSYSVDTIQSLVEQCEDRCEFYFIIGADELNILPEWHKIEELVTLCRFIIAKRPGVEADMSRVCEMLGEAAQRRFYFCDTPELEISSTDIRKRIRDRQSVRYILPQEVEAYVRKEGLYL
ncbi:nicotinate-nucleotide adenylyltransferase [Selenomonas sp. TAMA-11512]|uniref:nicotinate-nucleotide adenylyltransferase n=1 Tax=Selenomonas sp. TAMA-11512 TaxID=3095337 RepID=UPI00308AA6D3|nr:nicotinate-nucleotide adenylyltransferase [Selenomonas sp. TAMA-11512]